MVMTRDVMTRAAMQPVCGWLVLSRLLSHTPTSFPVLITLCSVFPSLCVPSVSAGNLATSPVPGTVSPTSFQYVSGSLATCFQSPGQLASQCRRVFGSTSTCGPHVGHTCICLFDSMAWSSMTEFAACCGAATASYGLDTQVKYWLFQARDNVLACLSWDGLVDAVPCITAARFQLMTLVG
jgi:hypothetical protein